ncbi:hypothetical protein [Paraburkholderia sacchari]|uniref:hypothetical protein n=1 Tax=Paraburkholderia sacchari TaxID=159450 RepID=UPI0005431EC0|nr:hypothetical protein [Paraburkholderia sacchari]NLP62540.1 hypothetical protein [Paraburkholderia sacchari]
MTRVAVKKAESRGNRRGFLLFASCGKRFARRYGFEHENKKNGLAGCDGCLKEGCTNEGV